MFHLDCTAHSAVIVCDLCRWRAGAPDRLDAWKLANHHERTAHPSQLVASNALSHARRRV